MPPTFTSASTESLVNNTAGFLRVHAVTAKMLLNAEAGERFVGYEILNDKGEAVSVIYAPAFSTISKEFTLTGLLGFPYASLQNLVATVPLPEFWLPPNWQIRIVTTGKKAGDTMQSVKWQYELSA